MTTTVGCLQPTYIPWIQFFKRFLNCDFFVLLDDVDYSKHKFQNRTYVKLNNTKSLLTVPVHYKMKVPINKIKIDNSKNWKKKHYQTIVQAYSKSQFFSNFQKDFEKIYQREWDSLFKLNLEILNFFKSYFNIQKEIYISSKLNVIGDGNEKLVNICKYFDAKYFVVKRDTENYHPRKYFQNNNIDFKYHENSILEYNQLGNNFLPNLSIIDYASNNGNKFIF